MSEIKIHPSFRLNGQKIDDIKQLTAEVTKNLPEHALFIQELFNQKEYIFAQSSGSTGKPKQIKIEKKFLLNSARMTIDFFELIPETKALLNLSSQYIAGKLMWVRALIGGWYLWVVSPDNQSIATHLAKQTYDFGAMVPIQAYHNLKFLSNIKKLIIGGGVISQHLNQKLQNIATAVYGTYGMTETVTHIAIKPINKTAGKNFYNQQKLEGSYRTIKGIKISKDDRDCLVIDAPQLASKPIITNDLVKIIDNHHFKWLGRYDNIINSGGIKFIPEQIENKLKNHIKNDFFIAGLPDEKLGQKIVLFVEGTIDKNKMNQIFEQLLATYEKPKTIIELPEFVRTPTGKIKRYKTIDVRC